MSLIRPGPEANTEKFRTRQSESYSSLGHSSTTSSKNRPELDPNLLAGVKGDPSDIVHRTFIDLMALREMDEGRETLYFAYGSNLAVTQMAQRCPNSRLQGRALLHQFEWQINDRGFANVIPSPDPRKFVEGLCYLLTPEDEARLDRNEGVPKAYQKMSIDVEFFPASMPFLSRKVTDVVRTLQLFRDQQETVGSTGGNRGHIYHGTALQNTYAPIGRYTHKRRHSDHDLTRPIEPVRGEMTPALVYLSQNHTEAGHPWDEYIHRMNQGIREAVVLGVSPAISQRLKPFLMSGRGQRPQASKSRQTKSVRTGSVRRAGDLAHNESQRRRNARQASTERGDGTIEIIRVARLT